MSLQTILSILENNWPMFLRGAGMTLVIAIISTIIGALIGFFIGVMHTIPVRKRSVKSFVLKVFNFILSCYVEIFRGTPMIVQSMVIYYGHNFMKWEKIDAQYFIPYDKLYDKIK